MKQGHNYLTNQIANLCHQHPNHSFTLHLNKEICHFNAPEISFTCKIDLKPTEK